MLGGELMTTLAQLCDVLHGFAHLRGRQLRAADMLSKRGRGPRSGAEMTSRDAALWLVGILLDFERGEDVAESVRRFGGMRREGAPLYGIISGAPGNWLTDGMSFIEAGTAADAMAAVIDDFRTGRVALQRDAFGKYEFSAAIVDKSKLQLIVSSEIQGFMAMVVLTFSRPERRRRANSLIERQINIDARLFEQLAAALGPIELPRSPYV